jgi:mannan endo-1,4-beta-mannosidase
MRRCDRSLHSNFFFYGSVSYWLSMLDNNELDQAFGNIAGAGITVVRTWGFNDVSQKPSVGTFFQVHTSPKNA